MNRPVVDRVVVRGGKVIVCFCGHVVYGACRTCGYPGAPLPQPRQKPGPPAAWLRKLYAPALPDPESDAIDAALEASLRTAQAPPAAPQE